MVTYVALFMQGYITSHSKGEADILKDLVSIANKHSEATLIQFQSLVSAYQYRLLYYLFRKYVRNGTEVLDWGVGNGHFSYFLVRSGYKVYGFSFESFPVEVDLADIHYHFVQGNIMDPIRLPFKDNSFAAVTSVGVLEHVKETGGNDVASLGEIARVLKQDGVFVCSHLPNRYSLIEALARCFPYKHHHQSRYTISEIEALMKQSRLQLVESKRYGFLPRNFWRYAPKRLRNTKILALSWNILDTLLAYPFTLLCQNYIFVARKQSKGDSNTI